jgi:hypothetical protein
MRFAERATKRARFHSLNPVGIPAETHLFRPQSVVRELCVCALLFTARGGQPTAGRLFLLTKTRVYLSIGQKKRRLVY